MDIRRLILILLLVYSIITSRDQDNVQDSNEDDEVSLIPSDDEEGNIIISYKL